MKFVKKETAIPGKEVSKTVDGVEVKEKVKLEIEVSQFDSLSEFVNRAGGETAALATINQKNGEAGASAFRIAFTQAIKDKKTEDEAIAIGRAEAKKAILSVRGPGKKEIQAQKDAAFNEAMALLKDAKEGKLSKSKVEEMLAKYNVA